MTSTKRSLAATATAVLLAASLGAAAHAQGRTETVKFQDYPGLGNLPIRIAKDKGWCEQAGINCELQVIATAPLGMQALIGGSIDVAMAPIDVTAAAVLRGSKVKAISGAAVSNIFLMLVGEGTQLSGDYPAMMADLKGKKIGVTARGSATETMFSYLLQQAGMAPDAVTYVAVGAPNTAFAALTNGQVDAAMAWEPAGIQCELTQKCRAVWRSASAEKPQSIRDMYGANTSYVMRADALQNKPQVAEAIGKVVARADAFINDQANADEVLRISGNYFKFDMPAGDTIARRTLQLAWQFKTFRPIVDREAVKVTLDYLASTKQIPKPITVDDLVWAQAPER